MKKKLMIGSIILAVALGLILLISFANSLLTDFIETTNIVCPDQKFSSPEEAVQAMEAAARAEYDVSLDYCPPYKLMYAFDYEENTIIFYSFCNSYDGTPDASYAVRILKHNDDGTLSFDGGFADFHLNEPDGYNDYYYFTNIQTSKGKKSISFLYLPEDSAKDVYIDGIKAEKLLASVGNQSFYICYAISNRDTFLSNLFTLIYMRHTVEVR